VNKNTTQEIGMNGLTKIAQKQKALKAFVRVNQLLQMISSGKLQSTDDATILVITKSDES